VIHQEDIHEEVHVHQERPQFLKDLGVDVLIMNGMGKGAYNRLIALIIKCVSAENKSVEDALGAYLNKTLTTILEAHECSGCGSHEHGHKGHNHG
jgi:predicted Fe-Mo cluster-binding NifX family protein